MEITLTVSKVSVYNEVAKTTSYTGAKMVGDEGAYNRIFTPDEDQEMLERFWDESRAEVAQAFIRMVSSEGMDGDAYNLVLHVSEAFDDSLLPGMQLGLYSYFVNSLAGKWYVYTNKGEAGDYIDRGSALLEEVKEKAMHKKRPTRPTYS